MSASDPLSDEGIPTRMGDHQALAYELCRANYTFWLASQLFNIHPGIKKSPTWYDQAVMMYQTRLRHR
ncbi:hypothetical protein TELCIR_11050 [Teladorsagia circumcincta]|uniref:Uncharacterized protein n=1 Tax=Teladorsagia circumcincta TaxID=45464 RepID=A0A2G9UAF9_TELCI|nr:hypothetical protein TELCIR_11050 [Teladorsagia circumcincta]